MRDQCDDIQRCYKTEGGKRCEFLAPKGEEFITVRACKFSIRFLIFNFKRKKSAQGRSR